MNDFPQIGSFSASTLHMQAAQMKRKGWQEYQADCRDRMGMLRGDWLNDLRTYVEAHVSEQLWNELAAERYHFTREVNVLRDTVSLTALVYSNPARRSMVVEAPDGSLYADPAYNEILEGTDLDSVFHIATESVMVCGGGIIFAHFDDDDETMTEWVVHCLTPDLFILKHAPGNPERLTFLECIIPSPDSYNNRDTGVDWRQMSIVHIFDIEDPDNPAFVSKDSNGKILNAAEGEEYPYWDESTGQRRPVIPASLVNFETETTELFNRTAGLDLHDATLKAGFIESFKVWALQHSRKQNILTGPKAGAIRSQILDPAVAAVIPMPASEASVDVSDMTIDPAAYHDAVDRIYEYVGRPRGITLADYKTLKQPESGIALSIRNNRQVRYILKLQAAMQRAEVRFARVMRSIWNSTLNQRKRFNGSAAEIPWDAKFRIDFAEIFEANPYETWATDREQVGQGYISAPAHARRFNRDIDSDEQMSDIMRDNARLTREVAGISPLTEKIAGESFPEPNNIETEG